MPLGNAHPPYAPGVANNTEHQCSQDWLTVPPGAISRTGGAGAGLIGPNTPTNGSKRPTARNFGYVLGCSHHCLSSTHHRTIPTTERHKLRTEVGLFPLRMI